MRNRIARLVIDPVEMLRRGLIFKDGAYWQLLHYDQARTDIAVCQEISFMRYAYFKIKNFILSCRFRSVYDPGTIRKIGKKSHVGPLVLTIINRRIRFDDHYDWTRRSVSIGVEWSRNNKQ